MELNVFVSQIEKLAGILPEIEEILRKIEKQNNRIEEAINARSVNDYQDQFIPLEAAIKILNVSRRRCQTMRKNGEIPYIKNGKKILFTRQSINEYMRIRTIPATNKI